MIETKVIKSNMEKIHRYVARDQGLIHNYNSDRLGWDKESVEVEPVGESEYNGVGKRLR